MQGVPIKAANRRVNGLRRVAVTAIALVLVGAALVAGVFVSQDWLLAVFIALMMLMRLFGRGSHGHGASHAEGPSQGRQASWRA